MNFRKIYLSQIPEEGLIININLNPSTDISKSELNISLSENIQFKGMINPLSGRYLLSGEVKTSISLSCDRCLEKFIFPVRHNFLLHFVPRSLLDSQKNEILSADDEEPEDLIDDSINLVKVILEQIILQIPMKSICSENCAGLCSQCGANLNNTDCGCDRSSIDPRLLKLKDLLKK